MMICSHCRANNADDANFCQRCGKRLGTTGLDEPTWLSSPPVYTSTYGSISSGRNTYYSIEPGTPPPPPGVHAADGAIPYEQQPPLQTRRQKNLRRWWIMLSCLGLLALLATAVGVYAYSSRSTPDKTLATVCNAFKASDFPTVYN